MQNKSSLQLSKRSNTTDSADLYNGITLSTHDIMKWIGSDGDDSPLSVRTVTVAL